ncbi:MAG TPA: heavy metal-binding domain-containing protein [Gaiellaceae bacterium]|nr:heavy metal-binding domain-containing protein [Gaiellaceae bacterium]
MPLFRRGSSDDHEVREQAAADRAASLEALERGELPLRAQQRLGEIGKTSAGLFTSDLSVGEFALVDAIGLRPLAQVMGSSIYHVGWQQRPGGFGMQAGGMSLELTVVSEAWNTARLRAFARLEQEATLVGADAVVGVRLTVGSHDWAAGAIEYVAVGTAVRLDAAERAERPVLTDLSGQDYWKLWRAGYRPLGVVGASTVHYIVAGWATQRAQSGMFASWANQELQDFTRGVYDARETALGRMSAEARRHGAAGVVGVSIVHHIEEREAGAGSGRKDLVITFHVLGTAIAERATGGRELEVSPRLDLSRDTPRPHLLGGNR